MKARDLAKMLFVFGDKEVCMNNVSYDCFGAPNDTQKEIVGAKEDREGRIILITN